MTWYQAAMSMLVAVFAVLGGWGLIHGWTHHDPRGYAIAAICWVAGWLCAGEAVDPGD